VILEIGPKKKAGYELKKLTNESKGKPERTFDAAFGTSFSNSRCFKRSKQKLQVIFSLKPGRL
jgi:hypothetical protein